MKSNGRQGESREQREKVALGKFLNKLTTVLLVFHLSFRHCCFSLPLRSSSIRHSPLLQQLQQLQQPLLRPLATDCLLDRWLESRLFQ
jgi:hypothetical protein